MGLTRQSVHPMDESKSSVDEYDHTVMAPSQRIADQHGSESPRGIDLEGANGHGSMSPRAATTTTSPAHGVDSTMSSTGRENDQGGEDERDGDVPVPVTKSERQLMFADETGGVLAEITYSSRTHYSKQAGTSTLPAGRACCIIS